MNELLSLMLNRRSVRKYTGEPIPEDKIKLILQAGWGLVNHVVLTEEIDGENEIESFEIRAHVDGGKPITVYRGTTIGHKAICQFPPIFTFKLEISFDRDKNVSGEMKYIKMFS